MDSHAHAGSWGPENITKETRVINQDDQARSTEFCDRMFNIINDGGLALMISIGHQTGLFDVMATLPSATSEEIATAAQLNERYTREWLAAMVSGRIVEYASAEKRYLLPSDHSSWLTRAAGMNNLAAHTQGIAMLGEMEEKIVQCFKNGGGVPYVEYIGLHNILESIDESETKKIIIKEIISIYHMSERLEEGIQVADMGCGIGDLLIPMAMQFPNSNFVGYDLSSE